MTATMSAADLEAWSEQTGEPVEMLGDFLHLHVGPEDFWARPGGA